jgi:hypothetical protein
MQTAMSTGTKTSERPGITYRTVQAWRNAQATGRLGSKLFAAKLLYRATGVASTRADQEEPLFQLHER